MNYILTGGINLITDKIVSVFARNDKAIAVDVTGREYTLLTSTPNAIQAYIKSLMTALNITVLPDVEYHWFDLTGGAILVYEGTAILPDLKYDGVAVTPSDITYETTTQTISIFKDGKAFGLKSGTTKAKVSKDGTELSFNIIVQPNTSYGLYDSPNAVAVNKTEDMVMKYGGRSIPASACVWKSYDTGKFTVANGVVTGVAEGKGYVSCTYGGVEYIKEITVHPSAPTPDSEDKTLKVDETYDANMPSKAGFSGEKWISENNEVASVNQANGMITAKKVGTAKIVGRFTAPYEADGKIVNVTVQTADPQPQP